MSESECYSRYYLIRAPVLSRVEGPALSRVEGPALSRVEGPVLSRAEGYAYTLAFRSSLTAFRFLWREYRRKRERTRVITRRGGGGDAPSPVSIHRRQAVVAYGGG